MMRMVMALALAATLAGCDEKKDTATTTTVAPTPMPTTGVAESGETAKAEKPAAKLATKPAAAKPAAAKPAAVPLPGGMPHGNPEDGTLKYAPPPVQNPPAKKGATSP